MRHFLRKIISCAINTFLCEIVFLIACWQTSPKSLGANEYALFFHMNTSVTFFFFFSWTKSIHLLPFSAYTYAFNFLKEILKKANWGWCWKSKKWIYMFFLVKNHALYLLEEMLMWIILVDKRKYESMCAFSFLAKILRNWGNTGLICAFSFLSRTLLLACLRKC